MLSRQTLPIAALAMLFVLPTAVLATPMGDINCDGIVNLLDQALLAEHWLETN